MPCQGLQLWFPKWGQEGGVLLAQVSFESHSQACHLRKEEASFV